MDEGLVEVEEDGFESGVLLGQLDFLFGVWDFDGFAHAEHFDALVEVLAVEVHEIGGFVFAQAAFEGGYVVDLGRVDYGFGPLHLLGVVFEFDGGQLDEFAAFGVGEEGAFGDF